MISAAITSMLIASAAPASALGVPVETIPGSAVPEPRHPVEFFHRYVVDKAYEGVRVNRDQVLGSCTAPPGRSCTVTVTASSVRTIGLAFGATRDFVAKDLQISPAPAENNSRTCTSPRLAEGQRFVAHPWGNSWSYKIKREHMVAGMVIDNAFSAELHAFDPVPNAIWCGLG